MKLEQIDIDRWEKGHCEESEVETDELQMLPPPIEPEPWIVI